MTDILIQEEKPKEKLNVFTSCRFCEFKTVDEAGNQVGCEANLLGRFEEKYKHLVSLPVEDQNFDDEHGKYTAKKVAGFCLYRRQTGWKKHRAEDLVDGKTYLDLAREELGMKVTVVVHVPEKAAMSHVLYYVEELEKLSDNIEEVIFINWARISPVQFLGLNANTKLKWKMEFMLEKDNPNAKARSFDFGVKKVKSAYVLLVTLGDKIKPNFIKDLETAIVDELDSLLAVIDKDGPKLVQTYIYKALGGDTENKSIEAKIEDATKDEGCPHLIAYV